MAKFEIQTIFNVEGVREVVRAFDNVRSEARATSKAFSDFGSAISNSARNIARVGAALTGAATALGVWTVRNAAANDEISKLSDRTGVTTDTLQELDFVAGQLGINTEQLNGGLERFNIRLGRARNGTGALFSELNKTNPALLEQLTAAKNTTDAFDIYVKAMRETTNEQDRAALAAAAFGNNASGLALLAGASADEVNRLTNRARELGKVVNEETIEASVNLTDAVDEMRTAFTGVSRAITGELQPLFIGLTKSVTEFVIANREVISQFVKVQAQALLDFFSDLFDLVTGQKAQVSNQLAQRLFELWTDISVAVANVRSTVSSMFQTVEPILDSLAAKLGFGSGAQLGITLILLQLLGIFRVVFTGLIALGRSTELLIAVVRAAWIAGAAAIISSLRLLSLTAFAAILNIRVAFIGGMIPIFARVATAARLMWIAMTGPAGLFILAAGAILFLIGRMIRNFLRVVDVTGAWSKALENAQLFFSELWNLMQVAFSAFAPRIQAFFSNLVEAIKSAILSAFSIVTDTAQKAIDSIAQGIRRITDSVRNLGQRAGQALGLGQPQGFASGGMVQGPGSTTSDSILALLSNGEYVLRAAAVKRLGVGFLNSLNSGMLPKFATGGFVNAPALAPAGNQLSGRPLSLVLPSGQTIETLGVRQDIARQLEKQLRQSNAAKTSKLPGWYK